MKSLLSFLLPQKIKGSESSSKLVRFPPEDSDKILHETKSLITQNSNKLLPGEVYTFNLEFTLPHLSRHSWIHLSGRHADVTWRLGGLDSYGLSEHSNLF